MTTAGGHGFDALSCPPRHPLCRAAVRTWVCYSAASVYPFDDLLDGHALLPEPLQRYAVDRQHALVAVLERLDEVEAVLGEVLRVTAGGLTSAR